MQESGMSNSPIKAVREKLGESQVAFGERLGVNGSTVHRWETTGLPSRGTARKAIERLLDEIDESRA